MGHLVLVVALTLGLVLTMCQVGVLAHRSMLQLKPIAPSQGHAESPEVGGAPSPNVGLVKSDGGDAPTPDTGFVESPITASQGPVESPEVGGAHSPNDGLVKSPSPTDVGDAPTPDTGVVKSPKRSVAPSPIAAGQGPANVGLVESPSPIDGGGAPTPTGSVESPQGSAAHSPITGPSGLKVGFYKGLCPNKQVDVEDTLTKRVQVEFQKDPTILPALLRMQFHDCFVRGCDASILIDGPSTERTAGPNLSVRGYELIEDLKELAEGQCPGVVSCADIMAIATKETLILGGGPTYSVQTGRRDGLVSSAQEVILPSPFASVSQSIAAFSAKNFDSEEMVILLGCHTVGISHCAFFEDRLYQNTTIFDPNMDPSLREQLKPTCPQNMGSDNFTFLDQNPSSSNIVDNSFFDQIVKQRGILPIDQALARDPQTKGFVQQLALNPTLFSSRLVDAMVKMQAVDVLTGNQGEIRKVCSKFN